MVGWSTDYISVPASNKDLESRQTVATMRAPGLRIYPLLLLLTFIALPFQCISPTLASMPRVVGLFTTSTPVNGNEASKSMKTALDHYQIPYDEIIVPSSGISGPLPLLDINSKPKYFLIVLAVGQLSYPTGANQVDQVDQVWLSALTTDQWTQLRNYELENSVRRVSFDLYPPTVPGLALANPSAPGCCPEGIDQPLHWYPNDTLLDLGMVVDVENPPVFDTESLYHYPAVVGGDTNGTTIHPFMKFDPLPPDYVNETVAAVVIKDETRQHMMFFMAFASWSPTSAFLDDAWIQWGTKNNSFTGYGRSVNETRNTVGGGQSADQGSGSDFVMNQSTITYAVIPLLIAITYRHL